MKILLYGKNGWIGTQIYNLLLKKNLNIIISNNRIEDYDIILNEIKELKPDRILTCTGRTH